MRALGYTRAYSTRLGNAIAIQLMPGAIHIANHSRVSFYLTVIWKLQHALWLFGLACLMQKLCNLKCVIILIKFRWKWESLMMARTKLLSRTMVNLWMVKSASCLAFCQHSLALAPYTWLRFCDASNRENLHWFKVDIGQWRIGKVNEN